MAGRFRLIVPLLLGGTLAALTALSVVGRGQPQSPTSGDGWDGEAPTRVTVTFHGGAGGVSGSLALLEAGGRRFMVECGAFYPEGEGTLQEREARAAQRNFELPAGASSVDAVILSHAHLDHVGRLPLLYAQGYRGPVYVAEDTVHLLPLMLAMQVRWDESRERDWVWSHRAASECSADPRCAPSGQAEPPPARQADGTPGEPAAEGSGSACSRPCTVAVHWEPDCSWLQRITDRNRRTTTGDRLAVAAELDVCPHQVSACRSCASVEVDRLAAQIRALPYNEPHELAPGTTMTMLDAGHIPGSASILIETLVPGQPAPLRILFSGDLGNHLSALLPGPAPAPPADVIIIEGTYGPAHRSVDREEEEQRFRRVVAEGLEQPGGIVWIPAFALDRTQKVLHQLHLGQREGVVPRDVPIYAVSPTARDLTAIYRDLQGSGVFRPEVEADADAFRPAGLLEGPDAFQAWCEAGEPRPALLLTTTGMLDEAFSRQLLPTLAADERTTIALVGWQDPMSPGGELGRIAERRAAEGSGTEPSILRLDDDTEVVVRARIERFHGFSGHGDAADIDSWLDASPRDALVVLIHGEGGQLEDRAEQLRAAGWSRVVVATAGETLDLDR